jgi:XTP/dITP diphosphohydrolase
MSKSVGNEESLNGGRSTETFEDLQDIVNELRRECPWDREQTNQSLAPHLIEEAYEVTEAIADKDDESLAGELGDVLLHVLMHAEIASEEGRFTFKDVVQRIARKLVHRHPHIYSEEASSGEVLPENVRRNWEQLKMEEGRTSIFDRMPRSLPALQRAGRVQQKAADVGFDWPEVSGVWQKIAEEIDEFRIELDKMEGADPVAVADEFGDLLFSLVNLARFIGIDAEDALQRTTSRFIERVRRVEQYAAEANSDIPSTPLDELEAWWQRSKEEE